MVIFFNDESKNFLKLVLTKGSPFSDSYEGVLYLKSSCGLWEELGQTKAYAPIQRGISFSTQKKEVIVSDYFIERY